jgi:hypothetical protein
LLNLVPAAGKGGSACVALKAPRHDGSRVRLEWREVDGGEIWDGIVCFGVMALPAGSLFGANIASAKATRYDGVVSRCDDAFARGASALPRGVCAGILDEWFETAIAHRIRGNCGVAASRHLW